MSSLPEAYTVSCYNCRALFDALEAPWCNCPVGQRSLVCPSCLTCFCGSMTYEKQFWEDAPPVLCERRMNAREFEPPAHPYPSEATRRMKVLIIDDEEEVRSAARLSLFRVGGMEVEDASSGAEGLRMAVASEPDVVLLDVMMPVQDGPSVLAALRANPATARIPIVFLTAKAMSAEIARLLAMGARGVLTKPFDPMRLPGLIRELIPEV